MTEATKLLKRTSAILLGLALVTVPRVGAQTAGMTDRFGSVNFDNPMSLVSSQLVCGAKVTQGTPIAGNACGADAICGNADDGTSGTIGITGIPMTATVKTATLYWTVLTNANEASNTGQNISFNGTPIAGTQIGFSPGRTPCFPQSNTVAWKSDVTSLVSGDGTYTVSGFPGGNQIGGANFAEGASLEIVYSDPSSPLNTVVVYEGLAVTNSGGDTLTQTLDAFLANASGPVSATWFPVIGNGQRASETITFDGSLASIDFSNDLLLDGSTSSRPAGSCSYTDAAGNTECYWDDDHPDVSAAIANGDTSATVNHTHTSDCHTFVAMELVVSADAAAVCPAGGVAVDAACPPTASYKNHGEYVSCVAHAAEAFLAGLPCVDPALLDEIQSCIVNPRARSDVGKKP